MSVPLLNIFADDSDGDVGDELGEGGVSDVAQGGTDRDGCYARTVGPGPLQCALKRQ